MKGGQYDYIFGWDDLNRCIFLSWLIHFYFKSQISNKLDYKSHTQLWLCFLHTPSKGQRSGSCIHTWEANTMVKLEGVQWSQKEDKITAAMKKRKKENAVVLGVFPFIRLAFFKQLNGKFLFYFGRVVTASGCRGSRMTVCQSTQQI